MKSRLLKTYVPLAGHDLVSQSACSCWMTSSCKPLLSD